MNQTYLAERIFVAELHHALLLTLDHHPQLFVHVPVQHPLTHRLVTSRLAEEPRRGFSEFFILGFVHVTNLREELGGADALRAPGVVRR